MEITVIDGQGGGVGLALIEALRKALPDAVLIAVGTNSVATTAMLRAGATHAATGENAVMHCCKRAQIIAGPMGIVLSGALFGEVSEKMAGAVAESAAMKILIPVNKCHVRVAGVGDQPLAAYVEDAVRQIMRIFAEEK